MSMLEAPAVTLVGAGNHVVELSDNDVGSMMRIDNSLNSMEKNLENLRNKMSDTQAQLEASKAQLARPFEQEQEFQAVLAELASVNALLNVDKTEDADALLPENEVSKKDILGIDNENEGGEEDEDEAEM